MSFCGQEFKDSDLQKYSHSAIVGTKAMSSAELIEQLTIFRKLLLRSENNRINFENDSLSDEDCYNLTGISKSQFEKLCSILTLRNKTRVGILLTKLRTGLSNNILKTLFEIDKSSCISKIVKNVREAMMTQFVPQYMGFDHITRGEVIRIHTTIFARELLASGDSNTAILLLDGTSTVFFGRIVDADD